MKKLIFGVVIALFAIAPVASAAALTQQQVDSILGLLRAFGADTSVVANVESALTGKTVPADPAAWCHAFNTNLKIGDRSSDVTALHIALQKSGFSMDAHELAGHVSDYGDFGESTASAVSAFQEKYRSEILTPNGLSHGTGYVGAATRKKLNQLYGCGAISPTGQTKDWKIYTNSQYGFNFKYPPQLDLRNQIDPRYVDFIQSDNKGGSMRLEIKPEVLNQNAIQGSYGIVGKDQLTQVSIGGKTSYFFGDGDAGCGTREYRVPLDTTHHLSIRFTDCEGQASYIQPFMSQILETFKFTE